VRDEHAIHSKGIINLVMFFNLCDVVKNENILGNAHMSSDDTNIYQTRIDPREALKNPLQIFV